MGLFLFAAYGIKVFNVSISHDTGSNHGSSGFPVWQLAFHGEIWSDCIEKVTGNVLFNPYAASAMMFVMMIINGIAWEYLFLLAG